MDCLGLLYSMYIPIICFRSDSLWLEMRNLNHLPFGMIMSLDIGLLHPTHFLDMKYLRKNEKGQKKFWRPLQRPDSKKIDFTYFLL